MLDKDLKLGICGTSFKDGELRLPLHPDHLACLDQKLKANLFIEEGYGKHFGINLAFLKQYIGNIVPRPTLFEQCDVILLLKPTREDFHFFKEKQILWGWLFCEDNKELTQVAIDKEMTFIALESMYFWEEEKKRAKHVFYKNNEMGGYCSVSHSLKVTGTTNSCESPKRVAVIGFGNTARGAICALQELGYTDITVFTRQNYQDLQDPMSTVSYYQYQCSTSPSKNHLIAISSNKDVSLAEELANYDIIVNCMIQNADALTDVISNQQLKYLKPRTLIIDVTCSPQIEFEFAKPTSFSQPTFQVGQEIIYYGVDNSPSYLWKEATYEISKAILPYIKVVMTGKQAWRENLTIWKAIDINNGVIQNPLVS